MYANIDHFPGVRMSLPPYDHLQGFQKHKMRAWQYYWQFRKRSTKNVRYHRRRSLLRGLSSERQRRRLQCSNCLLIAQLLLAHAKYQRRFLTKDNSNTWAWSNVLKYEAQDHHTYWLVPQLVKLLEIANTLADTLLCNSQISKRTLD